jgi:Beta-lactamase class C and other penicillin binding proteins
MLRRLFAYTLSILLFLCFLSSGRAQQVEPKLQSLMEQHKAVGLAAVVVKNGKIIYEKSFGYKHLESQTLLSPKDIFRIASISKSFSLQLLCNCWQRKSFLWMMM